MLTGIEDQVTGPAFETYFYCTDNFLYHPPYE